MADSLIERNLLPNNIICKLTFFFPLSDHGRRYQLYNSLYYALMYVLIFFLFVIVNCCLDEHGDYKQSDRTVLGPITDFRIFGVAEILSTVVV